MSVMRVDSLSRTRGEASLYIQNRLIRHSDNPRRTTLVVHVATSLYIDFVEPFRPGLWPSRVTPSLRDWLGDREKQRHFIHGVEEVRVLSHVPCVTAFHRTPTEAAIESALYGVGSWLSGNESDVSNE